MKTRLKEFFKLNKFKIIFSLIYIITTLLVFLIGDYLHSRILEIIFAILYFPALLFAWNFQFLSIFKRCSNSFGDELCSYDQTIAVILSIPVFVIYVYIISCLVYSLIYKNKINLSGQVK